MEAGGELPPPGSSVDSRAGGCDVTLPPGRLTQRRLLGVGGAGGKGYQGRNSSKRGHGVVSFKNHTPCWNC